MTHADTHSPQEPALKPEELDLAGLAAARDAVLWLNPKASSREIAEAAVRTYLSARTPVPPAAAPVGELREDLTGLLQDYDAYLDWVKAGDKPSDHAVLSDDLRWERIRRALSAAPVAGDRETAGVEPGMGARMMRAVREVVREAKRYEPPTIEDDQSQPFWHKVALRYALLTPEWARPTDHIADAGKMVATPPSGGGDHAGGEAQSPGAKIIAGLEDALQHARATAAPASGTKLDWGNGQHYVVGSLPLAASPKAQGSDAGLVDWEEAAHVELAKVTSLSMSAKAACAEFMVRIKQRLAASRTGQTGS